MNKALVGGPECPPKSAFPNRFDLVGPCFDPFKGKDIPVGHTEAYIDTGMTLRDYFAAKAMPALIAGMVNPNVDDVALWAYKHADAMLAARDLKIVDDAAATLEQQP